MAVLVQLKGTALIRLALLPAVFWVIWLTTYLSIWKTPVSPETHMTAVSYDVSNKQLKFTHPLLLDGDRDFFWPLYCLGLCEGTFPASSIPR